MRVEERFSYLKMRRPFCLYKKIKLIIVLFWAQWSYLFSLDPIQMF